MRSVYIKFLSDADRARGFFELASRLSIGSFRGQIYQVPIEALQILDSIPIEYRRATDAEVKDAVSV